MIVLTLNSGSSSLKFGLYRVEDARLQALTTGEATDGALRASDAGGRALPGTPLPAETPEAAVAGIVSLLTNAPLTAPDAIGHRIVHGGPGLRSHRLLDDAVEREIKAASALSPLHTPAALDIVRLAREAWPDAPQAACFDTVFHAAMPELARTLPVARELQAEGVQRYGFHGLSCESIVRQLGPEMPPRLVIAHLGSGASVTAVCDGRSVDTSMGLTPSGGLVMATRSGDLDPGILLYLLREKGFDAAALEELIDHRSGLSGVSGLSGDLRALHAAAASSADVRLAIAMFCLSVAKQIAGMIVTLGGVDGIVFTGGVGEHDAIVRTAICDRLGWCGIEIDGAANEAGRDRLDAIGSRTKLYVLPSQEDEQIARHVHDLMTAEPSALS